MKIGPLELRRYEPATTKATPPGGELGVDGESWYHRYQGGGPDVNPLLSGRLKFEVYDEMATSDPYNRMLLAMERLPIRGATWDVEPASEDPFDLIVADMVRWNLGVGDEPGQMAQSWPASCDQALLVNRWGAMFEELVWDDVVEWTDADGNVRLVRPLARLAPRTPRSMMEVEFERGRLVYVKQQYSGAERIPASKLVYYAHEPEPGRWDGTSLLRAAWGPWYLKKQLMISAGIAWDRWAAGIPVVRYPASGGAAQKAEAEEIGRSVRSHEHAYVAFAGPEPTWEQPDGWGLKIEGGSGQLPDPVPLVREYGYHQLVAGLQQFMQLGNTSSGSRATAQVQDEPFYLAVEAVAGELARDRTRQVVRQIVDVNFGVQVEAPTLVISKIQSEDVERLARILGELAQAGFTFNDRDTVNYVRGLNHLPDLPAAPQPGDVIPSEGTGLPPAVAEPPTGQPATQPGPPTNP